MSSPNTIIIPMSDKDKSRFKPPVDNYPWRIVMFRWFLLAVEASLASFFVFSYRLELGIFYVAYGVLCLFLLLPLIRCVRCYYYGKRCNFGWGTWVAQVFPKDDINPHSAFYGYTILFWPLRIGPILLGIREIMNGLMGRFFIVPQGLFAVYLLVLLIHRKFYMRSACMRCHQRTGCPVYNSSTVSWITRES